MVQTITGAGMRSWKIPAVFFVHKATHHFDLVNWLLEQEPRRAFSMAKLNFYGPNREKRGERCLTCELGEKCEFYLGSQK